MRASNRAGELMRMADWQLKTEWRPRLGILQEAIAGTREVSMAVVASTLTTIAVFLPLVFVDGIAGQLFRDQALTVA
ncbi:efflux RND transporter permease subunit, partial [Mycobacterium tuberculosis]|uniref:efflux RND transporter permease subunit n=1 Tax=Mycobacterium tuberculosis TaxID=1773 RepID=UPI001BE46786